MLLSAAGKNYSVQSPDKRTLVTISTDGQLSFSIIYNGIKILNSPLIALTINNQTLGVHPKPLGSVIQEINHKVNQAFGKHAMLTDHYNELSIRFKEKFTLQFRVYNNGTAYRFITDFTGRVTVNDERCELTFPASSEIIYPDCDQSFITPQESGYILQKTEEIPAGRFFYTPILVRIPNGPVLAVTEADLLDYPGWYLQKDTGNRLCAVFPRYPKTEKPGGWNNYNNLIEERENYLALTNGLRNYPWRLIAIEDREAALLENDLVYLLASPSVIGDDSWIRPGKAAWDWWCNRNLDNVHFPTGVNTETYRYFIDFASSYQIEYIILDEGWSLKDDLTSPVATVDIPYLVKYGKEKNVGIILWCPWRTLDIQMNTALNQFAEWGIAGLKIDFMDRDDQKMVNFYERIARACAEKKLVIDFHGAYKPTGMRRTYPNVLNREGVMGAEYNKWSDRITATHNVTLPFTRMFAGPMDYTPGSMHNVLPEWFRPVFNKPMTMTTRSQQIAMFIVYYAPLQMLSDAPTAYQKEPDVTQFIASVPVVWDETLGIDGRCSEYVIVARRKGDTWFAAGMNGNTRRPVTLNLSFLGNNKKYTATLFKDGINTSVNPTDTEKQILLVTSDDSIKLEMLERGGFAIRFEPAQ